MHGTTAREPHDDAMPRPTGGGAHTERLTGTHGTGGMAARALDEVGVVFPAGRFIAVTGPSGAGESTHPHRAAGLEDAVAAAHADAVVLLADGEGVYAMDGPAADRVLERPRTLGDKP